MRICFVGKGNLNDFSENHAETGCDVLCFSFRAIGKVSFERELKGETSLFEDVALLSKEQKNVVVCGCYTDARGIKHKSVVVADRGRILGVSDMLNRVDDESFRPGAGVRLYDTSVGRMGVIVGGDLLFPKICETLSLCGAEFIVCIYEHLRDNFEQTLMRAWSFSYGVPIFTCACGYAQASDTMGRLAFASPESPVLFDYKKEQQYHLIETRKRGLYRQTRGEYS